MSKAVLVIDMPKNCYECSMYMINEGCTAASAGMEHMTHDVHSKKADWCPLVPMPEKKQNACTHGFAGGWNAAIDAIGGDT